MDHRMRIGALISGGGTNLQAIIDGCVNGSIDARLVFVGSDNPEAYGLRRAAQHGIPTFVVDYRPIIRRVRIGPQTVERPEGFDLVEILKKQTLFPPGADPHRTEVFFISRAIAEAMLLSEMAPHTADLLVLAGFMRNLTPFFIDRINTDPMHPRIMNIHPALLPAFPGTDGYGDTHRYGCKVGGCTVHFIDYGEDSGPIIGQRAFPIEPGDGIEQIREKGLRLEWELYPACIQLYAEDRLNVVRKTDRRDDGTETKRTVVEILPPTDGQRRET